MGRTALIAKLKVSRRAGFGAVHENAGVIQWPSTT